MACNCERCIHYESCDFHFNLKEYPPTKCNFFKDKSRFIELPEGINFIHSERLIKPLKPGDEYEWQSIYKLTLHTAGKSTSLETARYLMENSDLEFLRRTNIPYKEEWEI